MNPPENDLPSRLPVWDAMQMLFMDTEVTHEYQYIARVCAESDYSEDDLARILFNEVLPALRFNLDALPTPQWTGFELQWLRERILTSHRFGRRRPWRGRRYVARHWQPLRAEIRRLRALHSGIMR
ncbi:MAG: hypothetical protein K0U93_21645 [Gammaproteobacteria bacterium]|nr:hypothetical protein [Gammaproteobacteria bacterium]